MQRYLGARPELPDARDLIGRRGIRAIFGMLPESVSHRSELAALGAIMDQGQEASCVAHAVALSARLQAISRYGRDLRFSQRWLMLGAQKYDEWPETSPDGEDGTSLRACLKAGFKDGLVLASTMPYRAGERQVTLTNELMALCSRDAGLYWINSYRSCSLRTEPQPALMKSAILRYGSIIASARIPRSFLHLGRPECSISPDIGIAGAHAQHAFAITGWYESGGRLLWEVANSWGTEWGCSGTATWNHDDFRSVSDSVWSFDLGVANG